MFRDLVVLTLLVAGIAGCGEESTLAVEIGAIGESPVPLRVSIWDGCTRVLADQRFGAARLPGTVVVRGLPVGRRLIVVAEAEVSPARDGWTEATLTGARTTAAIALGAPFADADGDRRPDAAGPCDAPLDGGAPDLVAEPPCGPYTAISVIAGSGNSAFTDGQGTAAEFAKPAGVAIDAAGDLIIADSENSAIRRIDAQANVTTLVRIPFGKPYQLAARPGTDEIYVGVDDRVNRLLRTPSATLVTYAGSGTPPDMGVLDGTLGGSTFSVIVGLAIGPASRMFVAEQFGARVRSIDMTAGMVTTLAGTGTPGFADGPGAQAQFRSPVAVASDGARTVYVADQRNHCIRAIDMQTGVVSTYAGSCGAVSGYVPDDDGTRMVARIPNPIGVTYHRGVLYVSDQSGVRAIANDIVTHVEPARGQQFGGSIVWHPGQVAFRGCEMIVADFEGHRVFSVTQ